jgi:TRAP-type mannitol/chloroaromatic compound transport system permease small subunit
MLLGTPIFWGIAATSYGGGHITVDLLWTWSGPRWKRAIDVFATLVLLFVVAVQTIMLFDKVPATLVATDILRLMILVAFPVIALWLPERMG